MASTLEVWLSGTRQEIERASVAIGEAFGVSQRSALEPLSGDRYRVYLRATPPTVPTSNTDSGRAQQCEIPFPSQSSGT